MKYYPAFLNLKDKPCIVIGGGEVAERKIKALLDAEASVTVISPELTPSLKELSKKGRIKHISRPYKRGDLEGAFLVIAATSDMEVNRDVYEEASDRPVNVVDVPELCTFIVPSVIRKGDLTIAISTSGTSPALARAIREQLEETIPEEIAEVLDLLRSLRPVLKGSPEILKRIGSRETFRILIEQGKKKAIMYIREILKEQGIEIDGYLQKD